MFLNMIDNALSVVTGVVTGNLPSQRQVAQLISDGMTVAMVATLFDVGTDVIESLIDTPSKPS